MATLTVEEKVLRAYELSGVQPASFHPFMPGVRALPQVQDNYYRFLHYLAAIFQPKSILELGVYKGISLAYLASGCPEAQVLGVDITLEHLSREIVDPYPNIDVVKSDSVKLLRHGPHHHFGLAFIDTVHEPDHVQSELDCLWRHMLQDGVICIDDIFYSDAMINWWDGLKFEKMSLAHLHTTGFGVIINRQVR
jgi:predicted O-methyltransferase YrrM